MENFLSLIKDASDTSTSAHLSNADLVPEQSYSDQQIINPTIDQQTTIGRDEQVLMQRAARTFLLSEVHKVTLSVPEEESIGPISSQNLNIINLDSWTNRRRRKCILMQRTILDLFYAWNRKRGTRKAFIAGPGRIYNISENMLGRMVRNDPLMPVDYRPLGGSKPKIINKNTIRNVSIHVLQEYEKLNTNAERAAFLEKRGTISKKDKHAFHKAITAYRTATGTLRRQKQPKIGDFKAKYYKIPVGVLKKYDDTCREKGFDKDEFLYNHNIDNKANLKEALKIYRKEKRKLFSNLSQ